MPRSASQSLTTPCRAICSGHLSRPHRRHPPSNPRRPATTSATTNSAPMPPPGPERDRPRQARPAANPRLQAIQNPAATNRPGPTASWTRCSSDAAPLRGAQSSPSRTGAALPPGRLLRMLLRRRHRTLPGAGAHPHRQGRRQGDRAGANGEHPHHAAERCAELIKQGYSVALCDQLETTPPRVHCSSRTSPGC